MTRTLRIALNMVARQRHGFPWTLPRAPIGRLHVRTCSSVSKPGKGAEGEKAIEQVEFVQWPGAKYLQKAQQKQKEAVATGTVRGDILNPQVLLDQVMVTPSREGFHEAIAIYANRQGKFKRGSIEFVNTCLEKMDEAKIPATLETYNLLLHVFPEGRYVTRSLFDVIWPQYNDHVVTGLSILQRMEDAQICPDVVTYDLVEGIYGKSSVPLRKLKNMAYWFLEYGITPTYDFHDRNKPKIANRLHRACSALKTMGGKTGKVFVLQFHDGDDTAAETHTEEEEEGVVEGVNAEVGSENGVRQVNGEGERNEKKDSEGEGNEQREGEEPVGEEGGREGGSEDGVVPGEERPRRTPYVVCMHNETHASVLAACDPDTHVLHIEGPRLHWYDRTRMPYFTLVVRPLDGSGGEIGGLCIAEAGDQVSLGLWVSDLLRDRPTLRGINVIYSIRDT